MLILDGDDKFFAKRAFCSLKKDLSTTMGDRMVTFCDLKWHICLDNKRLFLLIT